MGFIGRQPTAAPLTSSDITDGIISTSKLANDAVDNTKLDLTDNYSFTGTITGAGQSLRPNHRPLIINGDMAVSQRGTSSTSQTSSGIKTVDRMRIASGGGMTFTIAQASESPTGQGFTKSYKVTSTTGDASMTSSEYNIPLQMRMEGNTLQAIKKGTSNAEKITFAFWVYATVTGTYILELNDDDNNRYNSQSYTVSSTNTWEKKIVTFPADTTGAFDNDNAKSLTINFWGGAGSDFTSGTLATSWGGASDTTRAVGQVNAFASNNNVWQITGLQLEVGEFSSTTIPSFQFETFQENLSRCQRYFEICEGGKQFYNATSHQPRVNVDFRQVKRATPTLTNISTAENCANGIQYSVGSIDDTLCARVNAVNAFVTGEKFFYGKFSADAEL
tara:strand:- start:3005 stop:4174 length:1170 start_codon:yes stop_codon:yes gene_type:complete